MEPTSPAYPTAAAAADRLTDRPAYGELADRGARDQDGNVILDTGPIWDLPPLPDGSFPVDVYRALKAGAPLDEALDAASGFSESLEATTEEEALRYVPGVGFERVEQTPMTDQTPAREPKSNVDERKEDILASMMEIVRNSGGELAISAARLVLEIDASR